MWQYTVCMGLVGLYILAIQVSFPYHILQCKVVWARDQFVLSFLQGLITHVASVFE